MTTAHAKPLHHSVAAGEIVKQLEHEIRMEIEYLLSAEGLDTHPTIKEAQKTTTTGSVPIEALLGYERLKKIGVTKENLLNACSESDVVEINGDGTGIKRKEGKSIEEFEPEILKKRKLTEGEAASTGDERDHDIKLYKMTLAQADPNLSDEKLKEELNRAFGTEVSYVRLSGKEAYFSIDEGVSEEIKAKLAHAEVEIFGVTTKIQECWDEDLDEFFKKHGKHLDEFLERGGHRRRLRATKDEVDLVFYNKKYTNIKPLEYLFDSILSKSKNNEVINPSDHQLVKELITYHDKFDDLNKNLKHFTVGHNPKDPVSRCFFAVKNDDSKMPFTFEECYTNLLDCFKQAREDIEVKK